jgi:hypothetical protein
MVFKQLNEALADHSGRAQDSDWVFCLHGRRHSSVQEHGCGWCEMHSGGRGAGSGLAPTRELAESAAAGRPRSPQFMQCSRQRISTLGCRPTGGEAGSLGAVFLDCYSCSLIEALFLATRELKSPTAREPP